MSSLSLPKVLSQRKATTLEIERENFEKAQNIALTKAINAIETPVKEKHVRHAIIGSFQERGTYTFWNQVSRLNIQGNPIVCWKFCHVLHKILREGHPRSIEDSQKHRQFLCELQKLWGLLRDGYGKLIGYYCRLLVAKLDFHRRNPKFPGNLQITDEQLEEISERDVNVYFQLSCEMFDYMDEILLLQAGVFGSLDMSRSNSMTNSGQCRLAPLIPCIQDSSHLYDFTVKLLFKLHSALPADTLTGHRDRFTKQYKLLQQFYFSSSNLQYFKYLIQVPLLPEYPPNFLVSSNLNSHVSPVVILHEPTPSESGEVVDNLVDVTSQNQFDDQFGTEDDISIASTCQLNDQLMEKDRLIQQLSKEIENWKLEMQKLKIEYERKLDELKRQLMAADSQFAEYERTIQLLKEENEELKREKEAVVLVCNPEESSKLAEKAKSQEEKFVKMKDIYNKLREEHITLIRTKADLDKQLFGCKTSVGELKQINQDLELKLKVAESDKAITTEKLQTSECELESKLAKIQLEKDSIESNNRDFLESIDRLKKEINAAELSLLKITNEKEEFAAKYKMEMQRFSSFQQESADRESAHRQERLLGFLCEAENIVHSSLSEYDNPVISMVSCTPEYLFVHLEKSKSTLSILKSSYLEFLSQPTDKIDPFAQSVIAFAHQVSLTLLHGKTTSQATPNIEQGDELASNCKSFGLDILEVFKTMKGEKDATPALDNLFIDIDKLNGLIDQLISNVSSESPEKLGDLLREELTEMETAIEEAANRIAAMMTKSKEGDSGIKLEVNGKILDACTTLMQAIKALVQRSRDLQQEIATAGRSTSGTGTTEFYNRNHRWTEGLISAAKVVGISAKFLVDAADKVVLGNAKFVELVAASQEIAAATAQLVVASKVKAERGSERLSNLSKASRTVTNCTGNVVATAKSCAQLIEESEVLDFSKLSLHQAKLSEMESQVRVLELENSLQKERMKLSQLRKLHYHMAGPSEGWEDEINGKVIKEEKNNY